MATTGDPELAVDIPHRPGARIAETHVHVAFDRSTRLANCADRQEHVQTPNPDVRPLPLTLLIDEGGAQCLGPRQASLASTISAGSCS